jgi:hypothetical protein
MSVHRYGRKILLKDVYKAILEDPIASALLDDARVSWDNYYKKAEKAETLKAKEDLWKNQSAMVLYDWCIERFGEPTQRYGGHGQPLFTVIYVIANSSDPKKSHTSFGRHAW